MEATRGGPYGEVPDAILLEWADLGDLEAHAELIRRAPDDEDRLRGAPALEQIGAPVADNLGTT